MTGSPGTRYQEEVEVDCDDRVKEEVEVDDREEDVEDVEEPQSTVLLLLSAVVAS